MRDVLILGPAARLESAVGELLDEDLDRDTVLQAHRSERADDVHQAADRAPFFGHRDEEFARSVVLEQADRDVAVVIADAELVRDRLSSGRQATTNRTTGNRLDCAIGFLLVALFRRVQRLRLLRAVAINRERLEAQLPAVDVGTLDVLDG
ncbi:MAG: hypothetical protein FD138_4369 [Planctomycetota bacterium]|nr:MAG: hypothetical protein FD138_4369 [Planctomycetota bacterium]